MRKTDIADWVDKRFGRLVVVGQQHSKSEGRWLLECQCDCGRVVCTTLSYLRRGLVKSCGCYNADHKKTDTVIHGLSRHPLHAIWRSMISRCNTKSASRYEYYGARGISVCDEWMQKKGIGFRKFYDWAISHGWEQGQTIDRINNDGNYSPENCIFKIHAEQCKNRRRFSTNTSGVTGVAWAKDRGKWRAQITVDYKVIRLGYHEKFEDAVAARKAAEEKHGFTTY